MNTGPNHIPSSEAFSQNSATRPGGPGGSYFSVFKSHPNTGVRVALLETSIRSTGFPLDAKVAAVFWVERSAKSKQGNLKSESLRRFPPPNHYPKETGGGRGTLCIAHATPGRVRVVGVVGVDTILGYGYGTDLEMWEKR